MRVIASLLMATALLASALVSFRPASGEGEINCAKDGTVTASSPGQVISQNILTNGQRDGEYTIAESTVVFTVAMANECKISKLVLYLLVQDGRIRIYHEIKASLALQENTPTEVFNTGPRGSNTEFATTLSGKEIVLNSPQNARYVIVSSNGGSVDGEFKPNENNWVEIEAWGTPVDGSTTTPTPTGTPPPAPAITGVVNIAAGKTAIASDTTYPRSFSVITNGRYDDYVPVGAGSQWICIPFGNTYDLYWLDLSNYWDSRYYPTGTEKLVYYDIQIESASDCSSSSWSVMTHFNSQTDSETQQTYETEKPKRIYFPTNTTAGAVRIWSNGNSHDIGNHYTEVAVWGALRPSSSQIPQFLFDLSEWGMELLAFVDEGSGEKLVSLYESGGYAFATGLRGVSDPQNLPFSVDLLRTLPNTARNTDILARIGYCGTATSKVDAFVTKTNSNPSISELLSQYRFSRSAGVDASTGKTCEAKTTHLPNPVPRPNIVVSGGLTITPSGSVPVGTSLAAQFTVINRETSSVTLGELVAGGRRDGDAECLNMPVPGVCPDFDKEYGVVLEPDVPHLYSGEFTPSVTGTYDFQVFYRVGKNQWYWNLPVENDAAGQKFMTVGSKVCMTSPIHGIFTVTREFADHPSYSMGIDLAPISSDAWDVSAPLDGTVVGFDNSSTSKTTKEGDPGNYVVLKHEPGPWNQKNGYARSVVYTFYFHLEAVDSLIVEGKTQIMKGNRLGKVGETGYTTGPHLHFEVRENFRYPSQGAIMVNPREYISFGDANDLISPCR